MDHETACVDGSWIWFKLLSFFGMFYRVYSPVAVGRKTGVESAIVKHFVPELGKFDEKYIQEPWKAPIADQKRSGCVIKGDGSVQEEVRMKMYPKPMFDLMRGSRFCIGKLKKAYAVGMYNGDNERAKDGTWKGIFGYKDENGGLRKDETNWIV